MKRRLTKLVVFLLLGAIVNVAVAWVILWKKDWTTVFPAQRQVGEGWHWPRDVPTHWPDTAVTFVRAEGFGILGLLYSARRLTDAGNESGLPTHRAENESFALGTYRAGWPMLGLAWENWQEALWLNRTFEGRRAGRPGFIERSDGHPAQGWWVWGIPVELSTADYGYGTRMRNHLPIRPSWPGFAINTIFYAAILWLLTLGPFAARRRIRRKRGHCIKCGYDLRGAQHEVCPECGVEVYETSDRQIQEDVTTGLRVTHSSIMG